MGSEANRGYKGNHERDIPAIIIQLKDMWYNHVSTTEPALEDGRMEVTHFLFLFHICFFWALDRLPCMHAIFIYSWLIFGMIHDTCLVSVGQSFFCLDSTYAVYLIQILQNATGKKKHQVHHLQGSSKWSSLPFSSAASVQYVVLPWSWLGKQSLKPSNLKESPNDQPEHCFQLQPKTNK